MHALGMGSAVAAGIQHRWLPMSKQALTSVENPDVIIKAFGHCTDLANGYRRLLGHRRGTAPYGRGRLPLLVWIILRRTAPSEVSIPESGKSRRFAAGNATQPLTLTW